LTSPAARVQRRSVLMLISAGLAGLAIGTFSAEGARGAVFLLRSLYREVAADPYLAGLGLRYASERRWATRSVFEQAVLQRLIDGRDQLGERDFVRRLRDSIKQDFREGQTEDVEGWRMSQLELQICAAAVT
jgi:hypothetical protein